MDSMPMKKDDHKYDEYAVQSAMDTLIRAEEIRADEKMMGLVNKQLSKKKNAINKIEGLKDLKAAAYEASKPDEEEPEDE